MGMKKQWKRNSGWVALLMAMLGLAILSAAYASPDPATVSTQVMTGMTFKGTTYTAANLLVSDGTTVTQIATSSLDPTHPYVWVLPLFGGNQAVSVTYLKDGQLTYSKKVQLVSSIPADADRLAITDFYTSVGIPINQIPVDSVDGVKKDAAAATLGTSYFDLMDKISTWLSAYDDLYPHRFLYAGFSGDTIIVPTTTAYTKLVPPSLNHDPTITSISNTAVEEDHATEELAFTVADEETAASDLTVTGASSNTALVPNANISFPSGSGGARKVAVQPVADKSGTAVITLTVSDGTLTAQTSFTLTVNPAEDAPVASAGTLNATEDQSASGTLVASDADGDTLTYKLAPSGSPSKGVVTINDAATGAYTYTPEANASGTDTFQFVASDGVEDSAPAAVTVTIAPVNDAPQAASFNKKGVGNTAFTKEDFSSHFSDVDGDALAAITVTSLPQPSQGTLLLGSTPVQAGDTIAYAQLSELVLQPADHYVGAITFQWTGSDGTLSAAVPAEVRVLRYVAGDGNGDGLLTPADALIVNKYVQGKITLTELQLLALDMNNDGVVNALDAQLILNIYLGKNP